MGHKDLTLAKMVKISKISMGRVQLGKLEKQ